MKAIFFRVRFFLFCAFIFEPALDACVSRLDGKTAGAVLSSKCCCCCCSLSFSTVAVVVIVVDDGYYAILRICSPKTSRKL